MPKRLLNGGILFTHSMCPYASRCHLALLHHGAPLTSAVHIGNPGLGVSMQPWYKKNVNPAETVPALLLFNTPDGKAKLLHNLAAPHDGELTLESLVICQKLDELAAAYEVADHLNATKKPLTQPLFPADDDPQQDPVKRFLQFIDGELIPLMFKTLQAEPHDEMPPRKIALMEMMQIVDMFFTHHSECDVTGSAVAPTKLGDGPFFLGDRYSLADVALIPFLARMRAALKMYCGGFDLMRTAPRVEKMMDVVEQRLDYRLVTMPPEYYTRRYRHYLWEHSKGVDPREQ